MHAVKLYQPFTIRPSTNAFCDDHVRDGHSDFHSKLASHDRVGVYVRGVRGVVPAHNHRGTSCPLNQIVSVSSHADAWLQRALRYSLTRTMRACRGIVHILSK